MEAMIKNLWNDQEATRFLTPLKQRIYSSQLLGRDTELVIHGGGNTSVKDEITNLFGHKDCLY